MSSKTLSSKVRIKTSELPPESLRRYGFFEDHPELDLSQTGFRKGHHHLRTHSPGDDLTFLAAAVAPGARGRRPVRPYSYVEPRVLRQHLSHADAGADEIEASIGGSSSRGPAIQHRSSTAWHHAAEPPVDHSVHRSSVHHHRSASLHPAPRGESLGGGRVLSSADYRDTVSTAPLAAAATRRYGRWSVYGSAPSSWTRSQSTPPDRYERSSSSQVTRHPIVIGGSYLTPRKNRESSIGVKLAESQTELDSFNRLLERTFRGGSSSSSYGVYHPPPPPPPPSLYSSDRYDYLGPKSRYEFNVYSPTKVTRPIESSLVYGHSDYAPYSSRYYSKYSPSLYNYTADYRSDGLRFEPWYLPYYSRGGYYSAGNYLSPSVGRYTTKYFY